MTGLRAATVGSLRAAGAALVELVLPGGCAGCDAVPGDGGTLLCAACRRELGGPARQVWPTPVPPGLPPPWAVADYDGAARGAILAHKEDGRLGLAGPLRRRPEDTGPLRSPWCRCRPGVLPSASADMTRRCGSRDGPP